MIFPHGILINYGSTDRSVEIIKKLCPLWEIRDSRNSQFGALSVDAEVMEIEQTISGFKMALNTTEFLIPGSYLYDRVKTAEPSCFELPRIVMVDENPEQVPTYELPLTEQKITAAGELAVRYLHNYPDGAYHVGRHINNRPSSGRIPEAMVLWYGYAPYTEEFIQRKLQIAAMIPDGDRAQGFGFQHLWGREQIEERRQELLQSAYKL